MIFTTLKIELVNVRIVSPVNKIGLDFPLIVFEKSFM
jgi:hypothetical protein